MINKFRYIALIFSGILLFSIGAYSQNKMVEREMENMVLGAVQKIADGDIDGAEELLETVIMVNPSSDQAWYYMGEVAIYKSDLDAAIQYNSKAVELDPDNFWYRYRLAKLYSYSSREVGVEKYAK